ncbi:MAG: hypothetical protein VB055_06250 [Oscillospiraceae bacterium]|nr:hypothetical protein [Oscillospiraceae bacterium]
MIVGSRAKPQIPPVDVGVYPSVCVGVVDLGEQEMTFKNKTHYSNRVKIIFELPGELIDVDGEQLPRQLSRNFTISASTKSSIRQFVGAWLGKTFSDADFENFDLKDLLDRPALLNVVHSEDGQYANIASAMSMPKGIPAPKRIGELLYFDTQEWDDATFDAMPEYLQEQLKKSSVYRDAHLPDQEVSVDAANAEAAKREEDFKEVNIPKGACPF